MIFVTTTACLALAACGANQEAVEVTSAPEQTQNEVADEGEYAPANAVKTVPPPPSPSAVAPATHVAHDAAIMVTGSRIAGPAAPPARYAPYAEPDREQYQDIERSEVVRVADVPVSTFSIDVDTGSYANVRRFLTDGRLPPSDAVRVEEMINYFNYRYPVPRDRSKPFSVNVDAAVTPWNRDTHLVRIGLKGYDIDRSERPPANLVFLIDTSGSMSAPNKLPLVKKAMVTLAREMQARDRMSIVVYAGSAGLVLEPTNDPLKVEAALEKLQSGGSTAGAAGIALAYKQARAAFIEGGVNRVMLATDGDFNVGTSNRDTLVDMVKREAETGVQLTTLGFGQGNFNEAMMEQIADNGNGNYAYIDSVLEARKVLSEEVGSTLFTIAGDVKVQVEWNPATVAEYRLIGYENRALSEQDFSNDKVDAGEIGAGHDVTALYEIALVGSKGAAIPDRRYQANRPAAAPGNPAELGELRLRYKLPGETKSRLLTRVLPVTLAARAGEVRGDMALAAAVAAFGQKLSGGEHIGDMSYRQIANLVPKGDYYSEELRKLVQAADTNGPSR
ncbi:VWA domain-containing protein [Pacificimonas sp. WHA3]|uniref:VWA domain-containing protein n=2 Tax=Pacificimonas pallii TaxID=2827236 RepID=A0ABS6SD26_9SPHN|nr:VWA domain-containing protein [Pacificimonas pallii]